MLTDTKLMTHAILVTSRDGEVIMVIPFKSEINAKAFAGGLERKLGELLDTEVVPVVEEAEAWDELEDILGDINDEGDDES